MWLSAKPLRLPARSAASLSAQPPSAHLEASPRRAGGRCAALLALATAASAGRAPAQVEGLPIELLEGFVLAPDRGAFTSGLLPGSTGQRALSILAGLEQQRFGEVEGLLSAWRRERPAGPDLEALEALEARLALLRYPVEPERTWDFLARLFPEAPTARGFGGGSADSKAFELDPERVSEARYRALRGEKDEIEFQRWSRGARWNFDPRGLPIADQQHWLKSGVRPDAPALPAVLFALFDREAQPAFEGLVGKTRLLPEQLEGLAAAHPELLAQDSFLKAWIEAHGAAEGGAEAPGAVQARLDGLARRLPPSKAGLALRIELAGLRADRAAGRLDEQRLGRALALGADEELADRRLVAALELGGYVFGTNPKVDLPALSQAQGLVRPHLLQALAGRPDLGPYAQWLDADAGRALWVEAQLLAGDPRLDLLRERLGDDTRFAELEARRELSFDPALPARFPADSELAIGVHTKGLRELGARLFALDPAALVRGGLADAVDLDLTGFEPLETQRILLRDNPFERQVQRLEFKAAKAPGLYLIELHGAGLRSRLLVHKGGLFAECRPSAAGTAVRLVDELGRPRPGARLWLEQREFVADGAGLLFLPFAPVRRTEHAVLLDSGRVGLERVSLYAEEYELGLSAHVETESLRPGASAELLARPHLELAGAPLPLALLADLALELSAELPGGQRCLRRYGDLELPERGEWRLPFEVPAQASRWRLRLSARIQPTGGGAPLELHSEEVAFDAARVRQSEQPAALLLARSDQGYALELRGRAGEPYPGQELVCWFHRRGYPQRLGLSLCTGADGRVRLGSLEGIKQIEVEYGGLASGNFTLEHSDLDWPEVVHAGEGEAVRLPLPVDLGATARFSLLERRGEAYASDRGAALRREPAALIIESLPPGDYSLFCVERDRELLLRIAPSAPEPGQRRLERRDPSALAIAAVDADAERLNLRLAGVDPGTRVYLLAGRYASERPWSEALAPVSARAPAVYQQAPETLKLRTGARLSDEERYVFERRFLPKFPGSLLERPGLLLAPWDRDRVDLGSGEGASGGGAQSQGGGNRRGPDAQGHGGAAGVRSSGASFPDLAALPAGPRLLGPLTPDGEGRVSIKRAALGDGPWVRILALSERGIASATWLGPERPWTPRPLAAAPLEPGALAAAPAPLPLRERRLVHGLAPGEGLSLGGDQASAAIADLAAAFDLLAGGPEAQEFSRFRFLTRWPTLDAEQRLELYDSHVCHELNFFLKRRDPEFFAAVVLPALRNKGQRDLFDRWLLGEPLQEFLAPARFQRLSAFERLLLLEASGASPVARRALAAALAADQPVSGSQRQRAFDAVLAAAALGGGPSAATLNAGGEAEAPGQRPGARAPAGPASGGPTTGSPGAPPLGGGPTTGADRELEARENSRPFPRGPGHTRAWVESHWWRRTRAQGPPEFVGSDFWIAYAERPGAGLFLALPRLPAEAGVSERLLALAVLDLPFEGLVPRAEAQGESRRLVASAPLLVLERRFEPGPVVLSPELALDAQWLRVEEPGSRSARRVPDGELEAGQPYRLRVTARHTGAESFAGELLISLPPGALALDGGPTRRTLSLSLSPLDRESFEIGCYFPAAGRFEAGSADVHAGDSCVARAAGSPIRVRPFGDPGSEPTLEQRIRDADPEPLLEILAACEPAELSRLAQPAGDALAQRLEDPELCRRVLALLRERLWFDAEWWAYGLRHKDPQAARELLAIDERLRGWCAPAIASPLLRFDPFLDHGREALDFAPLWPARAHAFGGEPPEEDELRRCYRGLLEQLAFGPVPDDGQRVALCIHWLYQGRQGQALELFAGIRREGLSERVQYDYLAANLALLEGDLGAARAAAARGLELPLPRWRGRFEDLLAFVDAVDGRAPLASAGASDARRDPAPEASLAFEERGGQLCARWSGLDALELCLYPIDLELAFSRDPFATGGGLTSGAVLPSWRGALPVSGPSGELPLDLPAEFALRSCLIELRSGALSVRRLSQPAGLSLELAETQGRLTARQLDGRPAAAAYVKVYAREPGGVVRFHKDGYTDLLGRFDYGAVTPPPPRAERFAILVLDESGRARLVEAGPGPR